MSNEYFRLKFIEDADCPEDRIYFIPNLPGLKIIDGELRILDLGKYRSLTDDERKQFAQINLGETNEIEPTANLI